MRRILCCMVAFFAVVVVSCMGYQVKQMTEGMADASVKIMEAQAKIDKEKRQERYTIEGVIKGVEMVEKEIPDPNPKNVKVKEDPFEKGTTVTVEQPKVKVQYCVVTFADGRKKEFKSVPTSPLNAGMYYKIGYNGMGEVIDVEQVKQ